MNKYIYILIAFLTTSSIGFTQKKNAYGSDKGIYILNTLSPANKTNSKKGVGYAIERSVASENTYKLIAKYSTPSSIDEFIARANLFKYPYQTDINNAELLKAWSAFNATQNWDSLKKHLSMNYVAAGFGVIYFDSTANKNQNYVYRISILSESGNIVETLTTNSVSFPELMTYSSPKFYKQTTDGISVTTIWQSKDRRLPHHFKVYRSNSEIGKLEEYALSKNISQNKDTTFFAFTDNNVDKGTMYRYSISPSNNYGNYNVKSDTVLGTNLLGKDAYLPTNFNALAIDSLNSIKLSWKIANPYELDAIEIYKGIDFDGKYEKVISLSPKDSVYFDKMIAPGQRYFYSMKVIDRLGRSSIFTNKAFAICNGNSAPLPPVKVMAKATNQGVKVFWIPNGENIRGFYVYRCEGVEGEFSQISDFLTFEKGDSIFQYLDKDSTLKANSTYSYYVRQENTGHLLGEPCRATLVQPIHTHTKNQIPMIQLASSNIDKGILLSWQIKLSIEGVSGFNVMRKKDNELNYSKLNKIFIDPIIQSFSDTTLKKNEKYSYYISFVDMYGVEVYKTNFVEVKKEDFALASPYNLRGVYENNQVKLQWESTSENTLEFKIFRRVPGQQPIEIGKVNKSILNFTDSKVSDDSVLLYYIQSINTVTQSSPSNEWKLVKE